MFNKLSTPLCLLILFICGITIYWNAVTVPFQFDDIRFIVEQDSIKDIQDIPRIWKSFNRRFVTGLSLAFSYAQGQGSVLPFHIFNILVHLGSAWLIYFFIKLLFQTPELKNRHDNNTTLWIALVASLIFLCHPVQTNAVTYIWQRTASLAAFFYLLSVVTYIQGRLSKQPLYYVITLMAALLALFSKENVVTLPFMLVVIEIFFFGLWKKKKILYYCLGAGILGVLLMIPLWFWTTHAKSILALRDGSLPRSVYFFTQLNVLRTYLRILICPIALNLDYHYPLSVSLFEVKTLLSGFLHLGILGLALRWFRAHRLISFGIFWFYITISPESSFIPIKDVIFEHRLYLPLAGFALAISTGLHRLNVSKRTFRTIIFIGIGLLGFLTFQRNIVWQSELSLWKDVIQKSPGKARPHCNLAMAYGKLNQIDEAILYASKAIEYDPTFAQAYYNLGLAYGKQGDYTKSIGLYQQAVQYSPKYSKAYYNLGLAYRKTGDYQNAIQGYLDAIRINPRYAKAHNNIAVIYLSQGQHDKAKKHIRKLYKLGQNQLAKRLDDVLSKRKQ